MLILGAATPGTNEILRRSRCRIGRSAADGVVDEHGQVFDGQQPADSAATYPDLLVVDASVLPGAVVAQPTMTIVAQAIKAVDHALAPLP